MFVYGMDMERSLLVKGFKKTKKIGTAKIKDTQYTYMS